MTAGMTSRSMRCPGPRKLSIAVSTGADEALQDHLAICARCADEYGQQRALINLGRDLPATVPDPRRGEALRTSLLVKAKAGEQSDTRRSWRMPVAAAALAAAGVLLWLGLRPTRTPATEPTATAASEHNAVVQAPEGARFVHTTQPLDAAGGKDEVVRLSKGRVTVNVKHLAKRERFRVVTSDAEVEVRGTSFDVEVADDKLVEVRVYAGLVEVRLADRAPLLLAAGERWNAKLAASKAGKSAATDPDRPLSPGGRGSGWMRQKTSRAPADPPRHAGKQIRSPGIEADPEPTPTPSREPEPKTKRAPAPKTTPEPTPSPDREAEREPEPTLEPEPALEPEPTSTERAFQSAWKAMRSRDYRRAAAGFDRAITAAPDAPLAEDARYWKAVALARASRTADARRAMSAFLRRHPSSARAGEISAMLGWILLDAGKTDAAMRRFTAAKDDRDPRVRKSARSGLAAVRTGRK